MNTAKDMIINTVAGDVQGYQLLEAAVHDPLVKRRIGKFLQELDSKDIAIDEVVSNILDSGNDARIQKIAAYFPDGGGDAMAESISQFCQSTLDHPEDVLHELLALGVTTEQLTEWNYRGLLITTKTPPKVRDFLLHQKKKTKNGAHDELSSWVSGGYFAGGCIGVNSLIHKLENGERDKVSFIVGVIILAIAGGVHVYTNYKNHSPKAEKVEQKIGKEMDMLFANT